MNPALMASFSQLTATALLFLGSVQAAFDLGFGNDEDLFNFVTRPELRAPRFKVKTYHPDEVTPGYWFVAPYAKIMQESFTSNFVQPCQSGPAIYDRDGELVWSGACLVKNQNTCDFRTARINGSDYMSAIMFSYGALDAGHAVVMDDTMNIAERHFTPHHLSPFNMHEFKILHNGQSAVHIVQKAERVDISMVKDAPLKAGLVSNMGIREFDLRTGETLFEWWAHDHVPYSHSHIGMSYLNGPYPDSWDWLHLNAIDKNEEGDFLVTARYTDAIYKVCAREKSLEWSLGGEGSDFILDGFNVSGPHDAHFVREEGHKEYITFLDNGGDDRRALAEHSTAYLIELDKSIQPWRASVVMKWIRPGNKRSTRRGNFQLLDSGNAFVGWSDNCHLSEHSPAGKLLMEAEFASERFVSYRSYKFNFTSTPKELPVIKGFVFGDGPEEEKDSMSVYYASWNGATEVAEWRFYNAQTGSLLGSKERTGFETMSSQSREFADFVYAEALSDHGSVLGRTKTEVVERPRDWPAAPSLPSEMVEENGGLVDRLSREKEDSTKWPVKEEL